MSLDYARVEVGLQYTLNEEWDVVARVLWERKEQSAGITIVEPVTPAEENAMRRNIDLHHRSVALDGMGDLMLLGRRKWTGRWRTGDAMSISAGVTVPTGGTVDDPYELGDAGVQHLHIQFGTGTFDPLLEASYSAPLSSRVMVGGYLASRIPLYENRRGFHAPADATMAASVTSRLSERFDLRLDGAVYAQGYGSWNGEQDENTGLLATSLTAGATWRAGAISVTADLRFPVSQRTLSEGDAFTQGPTFIFGIGGRLK